MRRDVERAMEGVAASRRGGDGMQRRSFLQASIATAAVVGASSARADQQQPAAADTDLIDTHVYFGHWPFRRIEGGETSKLLTALRSGNVSQAWVGTFEGLLHKDLSGANQRLAESCRRDGSGNWLPFGAINPTLPDWEEDVRRCHETFGMRGIRLHPLYHGYTLADRKFLRVLELAGARKLIVQLVAWMDDSRPPYLRLPSVPVDFKPLAEAAARFPKLQLMVFDKNASTTEGAADNLFAVPNIYVGASAWNSGISEAKLSESAANRIVMASWAPLHTTAIAEATVHGAAPTAAQVRAIRAGNARRILDAARS